MQRQYTGNLWLTNANEVRPEDLNNPEFDGFSFVRKGIDLTGNGWVLLGETTLTVNIDEGALMQQQVDALQAEKQRVMAAAQARITEIEGQIQQLLSLPLMVDG